jgi:hypothetical protein
MYSQDNETKLINYLLERRLMRLPKDVLINFLESYTDMGSNKDFSKANKQVNLVQDILKYYQIKESNSEFREKFKDFIRDKVLAARESIYLISVDSSEQVIDWIRSWSDNSFIGENFNFSLSTSINFREKYLDQDKSEDGKISFPSLVFFMLAAKKESKPLLSSSDIIDYYPTVEFEIIFRENLNIIEVRGSYKIARDFVNTAILDSDNPLSMARSVFIGEEKDQKNSLVKPIRKIVKIEELKASLEGVYQKLASSFPGDKTSKIEVDLDDLQNIDEETHPVALEVITEISKEPAKASIGFSYKDKKYSFSITKTGGLLFRKYITEEVVTHIIQKILFTSGNKNG